VLLLAREEMAVPVTEWCIDLLYFSKGQCKYVLDG
jgi:hypothetical protein